MSVDVSKLTTPEQCEEVLSIVDAKLAGLQNRDSNQAFAEDEAERKDASKARRLADVEADIDTFTYNLAKPDLSEKRREEYTTKLRKANDQRDNLLDPKGSEKPVQRVLADILGEQVDAQVAVLTDAQTRVRARLIELKG